MRSIMQIVTGDKSKSPKGNVNTLLFVKANTKAAISMFDVNSKEIHSGSN